MARSVKDRLLNIARQEGRVFDILLVRFDLDAAIRATFERRRAPIPKERPPGLSAEVFGNEGKQRQWRAYAASLELDNVSLESITEAVWELVGPSCARIVSSPK